MNRKSANDYDSDDSSSDWDTTAAESPVGANPPSSLRNKSLANDPDGDYATVAVKPKPRFNLKGSDPSSPSVSSRSPPQTTPRSEAAKRKEEVFSPPPHLESFKKSLSDYSEVYEPAPDVPPKLYNDRGQVYAIPETDRSTPQVTIDWDDSDADEKVLQELRHNREREKDRQKQEAKGEVEHDLQPVSLKTSSAADNHGYEPSPKTSRSSKSVLEQWTKESVNISSGGTHSNNAGDKGLSGRSQKLDRQKKNKTRKPALLPVTVRDSQGKKCIFYFEETNQQSLETFDDDIDAFLPNKVEEIEMIYKRVWREIFSAIRIVTSFFVFFATELLSLVIHHIIQPLVLDSLTAVGNYIVKPLMTIVFNMIVHPFFALVWNTFNAIFMAAGPFVQLLGAIFTQIAIVLQSFRLFQLSYHSHSSNSNSKPPEVV